MNCKPGDVARYVGTQRRFHGYIVVVLHEADPEVERLFGPGPWWVTSPMFTLPDGRPASGVHDRALRPLRPGDGDDETLTWAGKPEKFGVITIDIRPELVRGRP